MTDRWKNNESEPKINLSDWADLLANRNDQSDQDAPESLEAKQLYDDKLAGWLVSDLEINNLLDADSQIEDDQNVDAFVDSVLDSIDGSRRKKQPDSNTQPKRKQSGKPGVQPFEMLDRLAPNGRFLGENDEYEIPEHLTSEPEGRKSLLVNGNGLSGRLSRLADDAIDQANLDAPSAETSGSTPGNDSAKETIPANKEKMPSRESNRSLAESTRKKATTPASRLHSVWYITAAVAVVSLSLGLTIGLWAGGFGQAPVSKNEGAKGKGNAEKSKNEKQPTNTPSIVQNQNDRDSDRQKPDLINQKDLSPEQNDKKGIVDHGTPEDISDPKKKDLPETANPKGASKQSIADGKGGIDGGAKRIPEVAPKRHMAMIQSDLEDARWARIPTSSGLGSEELELEEGSVEIKTKSGAILSLRAPAKFRFLSKSSIELKSGNLSAIVPKQAIGFTVQTPFSRVIDLGTEFDVSVEEDKSARVYVTQGVVEVETNRDKEGQVKRWKQQSGQSSVVASDGKPVEWLLSFQFDKNGFGMVEFNGTVLSNVVMFDSAKSTLESIQKSIDRKMRSARRRGETELRGAIVIENSTFVFQDLNEIDSAFEGAIQTVESMGEGREKLGLVEFAKAQQEFIRRHNAMMQQLAARLNVNQTGNGLRFPMINPNLTGQPNRDVDLAKVIADETLSILDSKKRNPRSRRGNQRPNSRQSRRNEVPGMDQLRNMAKLSGFQFPGLSEETEETKAELPTIQMGNEDTLKELLYQKTGQVNLFRNKKEADLAMRYVRDLNAQGSRVRKTETDPHANLVEPLKQLLPKRPDLNGLPIVMGEECRLEKDKAETLEKVSNSVGRTMSMFNRFGSLSSANDLQNPFRETMVTQVISQCCRQLGKNETVPGLVQMLQVDHPRVRQQLVQTLDSTDSKEATTALAQRAMYDLNAGIRVKAMEALKNRPAEHYRETLLEGLDYPWTVVAQHSAEALVRLNDDQVIEQLVDRLDQADPEQPFEDDDGVVKVRELVAINHMANCLLCHAPSNHTSDSVRGTVPSPGEALPVKYYQHTPTRGGFVRADVTYLRQDFSVMQTLKNNDYKPWPDNQRFDYVVRNRPANAAEKIEFARKKSKAVNPEYKQAIVFALRELTGKRTSKDSKEQWLAAVKQYRQEQKTLSK